MNSLGKVLKGTGALFGGYSYKLLDVAEGRAALSTMDLYLGCVILPETFSEDNVVLFTEEMGYLIEGDIWGNRLD